MKKFTALCSAAIVSMLAIAVAGCSSPSQGSSPIPNAVTASATQNSVHPGVTQRGLGLAGTTGSLYVTDYGDNVVKVLSNRGYTDAGTISTGIAYPSGITLDKSGNLYVANMHGGNVTEYAPGSTTPSFTYGEGMTQPNYVTTDNHGNLFEADLGGVVNEYFPGVNSVVASCRPGIGSGGNGGVTGVAVDKSGDVFAAYLPPTGFSGQIVEYANGLYNCYAQPIPIALNYPGGVALDAAGNLIVCETLSNVVDIIAPPYTGVTRTIATGFSQPLSVSLSAKNKRLFIGYNHDVVIVDYQTGATIKVLDNGLDYVGGAVDGPNAVY